MTALDQEVEEARVLAEWMRNIPLGPEKHERERFPERTCPYCGFTWKPYVPEPRACPRCKRYFKEGEEPITVPAQLPEEELHPEQDP